MVHDDNEPDDPQDDPNGPLEPREPASEPPDPEETPDEVVLGATPPQPVFTDPWALLAHARAANQDERPGMVDAYLRLAAKRPPLEGDSLLHAGKELFGYSLGTARAVMKQAAELDSGASRMIATLATDEYLAEMIYRPDHEQPLGYLVHHFDHPENLPTFVETLQTPLTKYFPPNSGMLEAGVILLPTAAEEYGEEWDLFLAIRGYLSTYLQVEDAEFRTFICCYIMMTWLYDRFDSVPYLRALGDFGSGKSRLLQTVGSVCYRPILAGGATTSSPIFRIIDRFRGTLAIDEADFDRSELWQDLVKILNCLDGATLIETDRGRLRFAQIVSKRLPVTVRSFDPVTQTVGWAAVTDWISGTAQDWFHLRYPGGRHFTQLKCTRGHAVLTPEGFVTAEYLNVGDRVMVQSPALTEPQRQVILGSLIGDATLKWTGGNLAMAVPWLTEGHGPQQFEYLDWKIRALDNLDARRSRTYTVGTRQQHRAAAYHTARCPVLREFVDLCLDRHGRRQVTRAWLDHLDPLGLAVWFMDDGNIHRSGRATLHARLSVTSHIPAEPLTNLEQTMYREYFLEAHGLNPTYQWDARIRGGALNFSAADTRGLLDTLAPYLRYQGGKKAWVAADIPIGARDALVPVALAEITKHHYPTGRRYYDVTVGATHTYIANAVASHNTGYQRGFPVLRSERSPDGEFDVRAYDVYGPKLLATRRRFNDEALESRCLSHSLPLLENLATRIPLSLGAGFRIAARQLRNKLLLWRFRKWSDTRTNDLARLPGVEPRANQIIQPLLSATDDPRLRGTLLDLIRKHSERVASERRDSLPGLIAQAIVTRWERAGHPRTLLLSTVVEELQIKHDIKKLSHRRVSNEVRGALGLMTEQRGGYAHVLLPDIKIEQLTQRYAFDLAQLAPVKLVPPPEAAPAVHIDLHSDPLCPGDPRCWDNGGEFCLCLCHEDRDAPQSDPPPDAPKSDTVES